MTHDQARAILADAEATITVDEKAGTATISGTVIAQDCCDPPCVRRSAAWNCDLDMA